MSTEQLQTIQALIERVEKAKADYASGEFNTIGRLNIVAAIGEQVVLSSNILPSLKALAEDCGQLESMRQTAVYWRESFDALNGAIGGVDVEQRSDTR